LLTFACAIGVVDVEALPVPECRLEPHDLGVAQSCPAFSAARLEGVEVALDALLELVVPVELDGGPELALLAGLHDGGAPGAAFGFTGQQLFAVEPCGQKGALALFFEADDADLDHALGEALLPVEGTAAQVLELGAKLFQKTRVVAVVLEVAVEPIGKLPVAQQLVGGPAQLLRVSFPAFRAPHARYSFQHGR
jgi:hypothetical protein